MSRYDGVVRDVRGLQRTLARQGAALDQRQQEDVVIDDDRRLLLRSSNGSFWSITVDDTGKLSTTNVGENPL